MQRSTRIGATRRCSFKVGSGLEAIGATGIILRLGQTQMLTRRATVTVHLGGHLSERPSVYN
jgi:hypothetical protein